MAKTQKNTFNKGIHFDDRKSLTKDKPIETMPLLEEYFIALSQHIGAPSSPVVAVGDKVKKGQLLAKASGFVSANIYSPVCGEIVGIVDRYNNLGVEAKYIHIKRTDGESEQVFLPDIDKNDAKAIKERILEAGIVGLGGAGFPTHVKVSPSKPIDTLIINAAECEPYLNCDNRVMLEYMQEFVCGAKFIAKSISVGRIIVGIEENKREAHEKLKGVDGIEVVLLKKKYPQGGEKQLIYACCKRKVPTKGLPMDVGVVVQNVATCWAVYKAVQQNTPLYERVLTVSGRGVNQPKNLLVLNGTPYAKILEFCGGLKDDTKKLLAGGPMMGVALSNANGVTSKTDSGLLALTQDEASVEQPTPCISCARCASVCPMNLMPMYIDFYTQAGDYSAAQKYGAEHCIECGCCAYVCPAKRAIVQSVKLCKAKLREKK